MILIFGGAYQGKLKYAMSKYSLAERNVQHCDIESMVLDFDKKAIYHLERFVLACIKEDVDAVECLEANIGKLKDTVIICDDISQGVVPVDPKERAWREMTGRCMTYLAGQADEVIRIFCGIESKVK